MKKERDFFEDYWWIIWLIIMGAIVLAINYFAPSSDTDSGYNSDYREESQCTWGNDCW